MADEESPHSNLRAKVVPDDTSRTGDRARVVIDFGEATLEDGHAIGGQILETHLTSQGDDYKVARLGFAVFADQAAGSCDSARGSNALRRLVARHIAIS
jgi:hypothetical protein